MTKIPVISIVLFLVVFSTGIASAQVIAAKGFKGGVNLANVSNNNDEKTDTRVGFAIGGFATFRIYDQFCLQPEIYYTNKGFISKEQFSGINTDGNSELSYTSEYTFFLNYLEIPILGVAEITRFFKLYGGPYFDYYLNGKLDSEINGTIKNFDAETQQWTTNIIKDSDSEKIKSADINKPGFGVLVGAECVFGKISVGARYAMGLTNVPDSATDDFRHKIIQVLVGYSLP